MARAIDVVFTGKATSAVAASKQTQTAIKGVETQASKSSRVLSSFGSKAGKTLAVAGKAAAAFGVATVGAFGIVAVKSIKTASDLGEQINKTNVVFRKSGKEVVEWSRTLATQFGISQREALTFAGVFGNMLAPMGIARGEAAKMSQGLVELSADMASFNNAAPTEVLEALRAGLAGETEPLRRFGVFLNEARIKAEALRLGLIKGKEELTASAKAQATYSLILKDTADAQGDFGRTSDSLANQQRIMAAQWDDLKGKLGKGFLPVMQTLTGVINDLLPKIGPLAEGFGTKLADGMETAVEKGGELIDFFKTFADLSAKGKGKLIGFRLADAFKGALPEIRKALEGMFTGAAGAAGSGGGFIAGFAQGIKQALGDVNWTEIGTALWAGIRRGIGSGISNLNVLLEGIVNWLASNRQRIADVGAQIFTQLVLTLMDPGFWIRHWDLALGVGFAVLGRGLGRFIAPVGRAFGRLFTSAFPAAGAAIGTAFARLGPAIGSGATRAFSALPKIIRGLLKTGLVLTIIDSVRDAASAVADGARAVGQAAQRWFQAAVEVGRSVLRGITQGITGIAERVAEFFRGVGQRIVGFGRTIFGNALSVGKQIVQGVAQGASNLVERVKGFFQRLWGWIKGAAGSAYAFARTIGSSIVRGIWEGISGAAGWLKDKIQGFADDALDFIKSGFGVFSPAKKTIPVGRAISEGVAYGIIAGAKDVEAAVKRLLGIVDTSFAGAATRVQANTRTMQNSIVELGRALQRAGYQVGEHPAFGGVNPVHVPGSFHNKGLALDINAVRNETAMLDRLYQKLKQMKAAGAPIVELLWRIKGHFDHLHVAFGKAAWGAGKAGAAFDGLKGKLGGVVGAIVQAANKYGLNPAAMLAVAMQESGLNPRAIGDNGASIGLFQFNRRGGAGQGFSVAQLMNPLFNAMTAARMMVQSGVKPAAGAFQQIIQMVKLFERPLDQSAAGIARYTGRLGEAQRMLARMGGAQGQASAAFGKMGGAAGSAASRIMAAMQKSIAAVERAKNRFTAAFEAMASKALEAFDRVTNATLTPAEAQLKAMDEARAATELAQRKADAQARYNAAQSAEERRDAAQELADIAYEEQRAALEAQAAVERRDYEDRRAEERVRFEEELAKLQERLAKKKLTAEEYQKKVTALLKKFGIDMGSVGGLIGNAFTEGLARSIKAVGTAAAQIAAAIDKLLQAAGIKGGGGGGGGGGGTGPSTGTGTADGGGNRPYEPPKPADPPPKGAIAGKTFMWGGVEWGRYIGRGLGQFTQWMNAHGGSMELFKQRNNNLYKLLAKGGIVTDPTIGIMGEQGAEAVLALGGSEGQFWGVLGEALRRRYGRDRGQRILQALTTGGGQIDGRVRQATAARTLRSRTGSDGTLLPRGYGQGGGHSVVVINKGTIVHERDLAETVRGSLQVKKRRTVNLNL